MEQKLTKLQHKTQKMFYFLVLIKEKNRVRLGGVLSKTCVKADNYSHKVARLK
jgi:hypothetical protein